ncbi:hypothetical protein LKO27_13065 [Tessaracoccus sp. OS52]|nr:NAD-dependent epimerase/dehydratase family protein [Tessaracoccus sp. OS52]MCC2594336.1 hypothetical protein [Tessaracoccus sp. OS52]
MAEAAQTVSSAHRLVHIAGVNRASDGEVRDGNVLFANQIAEALRRAGTPPPVVVYANSTQAGNGTVYGTAKAQAGDVLAAAAADVGAEFVDVRLPNLFGEHGKPFYNAVTATFCHLLAEGGHPTVENDKELTLLHAQNAADLLTGAVDTSGQAGLEQQETVSGLLRRLTGQAELYAQGQIPDISNPFDRDLFNTYRSYVIHSKTPISLTRHADARGSFFEVIRSHGGTGQSSFSTTVPGISRGDHYHRRKVERFTVLAGAARISLRRLFSDEVLHFDVTGAAPVAVDMPTMWAHRITNTGSGELYTSFWTDDLFDPSRPDTITEVV